MAGEIRKWEPNRVAEFIKSIPELREFYTHFNRLKINGEKLMEIKSMKDCKGIHGITKDQVTKLRLCVRKEIDTLAKKKKNPSRQVQQHPQHSEFSDDEDPYNDPGFDQDEFSDEEAEANEGDMDEDYEQPEPEAFPPPPHRPDVTKQDSFVGRRPPPIPTMSSPGRNSPHSSVRPPPPLPSRDVGGRPAPAIPPPGDESEEEYLEPDSRPEIAPPKPKLPEPSPAPQKSALFSKQIQDHHLIKNERPRPPDPDPEPISEEFYEQPQEREPPSRPTPAIPPSKGRLPAAVPSLPPRSQQPEPRAAQRPPPRVPSKQESDEEEGEFEQEYNEIPATQTTTLRAAPPLPSRPSQDSEEAGGTFEEEYNVIPADTPEPKESTPLKPWRFNKNQFQQKEEKTPTLPSPRKTAPPPAPVPPPIESEETYEVPTSEEERISGGSFPNRSNKETPQVPQRAKKVTSPTTKQPKQGPSFDINTVMLKSALNKTRPVLQAVKKEKEQDENKNPVVGATVKDMTNAFSKKFGSGGNSTSPGNRFNKRSVPSESNDRLTNGRDSNISISSSSSDSGDARVLHPPPVPRKQPDIVDISQRPPLPVPGEPRSPAKLSLEDQEWFFDSTDRNLTKQQLEPYLHQNGVFLVRKSKNTQDQAYTLAMTYNRQIKNIPICKRLHNRTKPYALGSEKEGEQTFAAVEDLVEFHRLNDIIVAGEKDATVKLLKSP